MPDNPEPNEALADLAMLGLEHGVSSVEEGGPLVPFVLEENAKGRNLKRFAAEMLEDSVAQARTYAASRRGKADRVAVAWDGYITLEGAKSDAIFVQAFEAGDPVSFLFVQRYKPADGQRKATPHGNPGLVDTPAPIF